MADSFFGITDPGRVRDNNEDAFIAREIMNQKFILACVIDGVGGYSGGEIAASIAREVIIDQFKGFSDDVVSRMKESFVAASERIDAEKELQPKYANMACVLTLALVDLERNQFYYAHLGDTRLYLYRDYSLVKVSKDHSFVGFLEESGRLSEEAAMQHPKRNEINKALGLGVKLSTSDEYIETGESPFLPGDLLLLCSDGLTDMVNKNDISAILSGKDSLEEKGMKLVEAANKNGGKDNITVVLVYNNKVAQKQEALRPVAGTEHQPAEALAVPAGTKEPKRPELNSPETKLSKPGMKKSKNNKGLVRFLSIISLILLATTLFLFWNHLEQDKLKAETLSEAGKEEFAADSRNGQEVKLQDVINGLSGDTLILSASVFPEPIIISDTLLIQKDSLHVKTNGRIVFRADPAYKGPALLLAATCKYVSLDSLVFENFDTGISAYNNALQLKNVRFNNCRIPVQNLFTFEDDKFVNGRILQGSFKKDSSPQKSTK
jgi:PPM family protein phosphatase